MTVLQTFLVFGDLDSFEGLIFTRMPLWELLDVLLTVGLELWDFSKNSTEVKSHFTTSYQGYILSVWLPLWKLTLSTWLRQCLSRFSTVRLLFPLFPYCTLWEKVPKCSLHLKNGKKSTFCIKMAGVSTTTIRIFVNVYQGRITCRWFRYLILAC